MKKNKKRLSVFSLLLTFLVGYSSFTTELATASDGVEEVKKESSSPKKERGKAEDHMDYSIEQLLQIKITSASKYVQSSLESPSAITVITAEDIEKSGTLDLTELFRFSPGVMVSNGNGYGAPQRTNVFVRGYPQLFSPRLLVLLDGIPIYEIERGGTSWLHLPISLASTDRVEIIRGASSTLYGANAFSGVINIISKKISQKQKFQFFTSGGNYQITQTEAVLEGGLSDKSRYRLSGSFRHDIGYGIQGGVNQYDKQSVGQVRFDLETDFSPSTNMKVYLYDKGGDTEDSSVAFGFGSIKFNQITTGLRLEHKFNDHQSLTFQGNLQHIDLDHDAQLKRQRIRRDTNADLQYLHHFGTRDTMLVGASARWEFLDDYPIGSTRADPVMLTSFFVNNDLHLLKNLTLTTGGRYEYDSYTRHQFSGRANLTYLPSDKHSLRVSVARAVRTPSFVEARVNLTDLFNIAPANLPANTRVEVFGNPDLKPESVLALEFGYNGLFLNDRLSTGLQFYFNDVHDFIKIAPKGFNPKGTRPVLTLKSGNTGDGQVFGTEFELTYRPFKWWQTSFNHTFTTQRGEEAGSFPRHIVNFKNRLAFKNGLSTELLLNWTGAHKFFGTTPVSIPSYVRLDTRVAKKFFKDHLELAFVGQNLIGAHAEAPPVQGLVLGKRNRVDRRVYGTVSFQFGGDKK